MRLLLLRAFTLGCALLLPLSAAAIWNAAPVAQTQNNVTQHQADALDRVIRTVDAIGGMKEQEFDDGGIVWPGYGKENHDNQERVV